MFRGSRQKGKQEEVNTKGRKKVLARRSIFLEVWMLSQQETCGDNNIERNREGENEIAKPPMKA
jgi:hypothetical protein